MNLRRKKYQQRKPPTVSLLEVSTPVWLKLISCFNDEIYRDDSSEVSE